MPRSRARPSAPLKLAAAITVALPSRIRRSQAPHKSRVRAPARAGMEPSGGKSLSGVGQQRRMDGPHAPLLNQSFIPTLCRQDQQRGALPMAQSSYGRPSDPMSDLKEKATDQFGKAADQAERMANRVAEQGRDAGDRMQEVAGHFKGALDKSVSEQPMATLAMAAILGFVLGALWKS